MEEQWRLLKRNLFLANSSGSGKRVYDADDYRQRLIDSMKSTVEIARNKRKAALIEADESQFSDEQLSKLARYTDALPLCAFRGLLALTPRLVNVVTVRSNRAVTMQGAARWMHSLRFCAQLAEAIPLPDSGITLPLDLHAIASKCTNAFYAPRRHRTR